MRFILIASCLLISLNSQAQLAEECKLQHGINLGGLADWGTELPFVDLMHNAREWYTRDIGHPDAPFNSEHAHELEYRPDGYPTHVPQAVSSSSYLQQVHTIWGITDGWPAGQYTVLWEGTGELIFWGTHQNLQQTGSHRIVFDFFNPIDGIIEMQIVASDINDPIRNIRVLMPGTETTYETDPFNPLWIEKLSIFPSVRFMDWGKTNNWGQPDPWTWDDPSLQSWDERARMDHYTWADSKGIPYEMMIRLINEYQLDAWICVPHRVDNEYIENLAKLFRDNVDAERHITVEYSNEVWNWLFGQTHWLHKYGCELQGLTWPEGIVPYVQNCLDIWSDVFAGQMHRITRVAGVQVSWQDVSNRIVNNLTPGSFDAVSPTFYFGLTEEGDAALDDLGSAATVADVAYYARAGMEDAKDWLIQQKTELANVHDVPLIFYEGGQHITPHPFGEEPTYPTALLDIQRDTSMYNMYQEWFAFLKTLQEGEEPLQLMNFSFIGLRSARYGSWGILETMDQDVAQIPAPKYAAILEDINGCSTISSAETAYFEEYFRLSPNPASDFLRLDGNLEQSSIQIFNAVGQRLYNQPIDAHSVILDVQDWASGIYFLQIRNKKTRQLGIKKFVVE